MKGIFMNLKRHLLIASASLSLGLGAATVEQTHQLQLQSQAITKNAQENSFLNQLKNNERIEYNGLYFDVPLFREKQKTNSTLADFDFLFNQKEMGIIFKEKEKQYLILMSAQKLESFICAMVAKDALQDYQVQTPKTIEPRTQIFQSEYPYFLIEEK